MWQGIEDSSEDSSVSPINQKLSEAAARARKRYGWAKEKNNEAYASFGSNEFNNAAPVTSVTQIVQPKPASSGLFQDIAVSGLQGAEGLAETPITIADMAGTVFYDNPKNIVNKLIENGGDVKDALLNADVKLNNNTILNFIKPVVDFNEASKLTEGMHTDYYKSENEDLQKEIDDSESLLGKLGTSFVGTVKRPTLLISDIAQSAADIGWGGVIGKATAAGRVGSAITQYLITENLTSISGVLDPFMPLRLGNNPFHSSVFILPQAEEQMLIPDLLFGHW